MHAPRHPDGSTWRCTGLPGYPILVAKATCAFTRASAPTPRSGAAEQTLPALNTPFADRRNRATVEWRFATQDGSRCRTPRSCATFTAVDGAKGEALVVSRITATEACHVAYIDALATPEASHSRAASRTSARGRSTAATSRGGRRGAEGGAEVGHPRPSGTPCSAFMHSAEKPQSQVNAIFSSLAPPMRSKVRITDGPPRRQ